MFEKQIKILGTIMEETKAHNYSELSHVEFKTNFHTEEYMGTELGETICAISNGCTLRGPEQGYIVIGVQDTTGELVGTSLDVFNLKIRGQDFELWMRSKLIGVDFDFEPFTYEQKNFLIIKISKSIGQVAKFNNVAYLRIGKYNKKLNDCDPEIQQKLHFCIRLSTFWYRPVVSRCTPEEIAGTLNIEAYYELTSKNMPDNLETILTDLTDEGFIRRNDDGAYSITYLGGLVLARNLSAIDLLLDKRIRVITYDGVNKLDTIIQDRHFTKGYAMSFLDAIEYIKTQIPEVQIITGGLRENIQMYPEIAIREFLANCLVHQDFLESGINPTVEIYKDRIELQNAGSCTVDVMRILSTVPKRRNEILVDIMRRMRICESRASGVARALRAIWEQKLPTPVFYDGANSFAVKMYNQRNYDQLTEDQKLMSCYYFTCYKNDIENVGANNSSLRDLLGIKKSNYPVMSRLISRCIEKGLIKEFDPDNKSKKFRSYVPYYK